MSKFLKIIFIFFVLSTNVFALTIDDLTEPKPYAGKISNSDKIESNIENAKQIENNKPMLLPSKNQNVSHVNEHQVQDNQKIEPVASVENKAEEKTPQPSGVNYADLSLKKLAEDISYELELDSAKTNSDLNILWAAATERSETMKYTIYKLSNPDEDKPDESTIKKILRPIANASSVVGASVSPDPYLAAGALVGGGLINAFMKDDKELNYRFSKVSDADMVLLVRKIGDLQKKLIDFYTDYITKKQLAKMAQENLEKREYAYKNSQNKSREELMIADVYYRNAKTRYGRAQDEYTIARAILENLVGTDALEKIEQ